MRAPFASSVQHDLFPPPLCCPTAPNGLLSCLSIGSLRLLAILVAVFRVGVMFSVFCRLDHSVRATRTTAFLLVDHVFSIFVFVIWCPSQKGSGAGGAIGDGHCPFTGSGMGFRFGFLSCFLLHHTENGVGRTVGETNFL